MGLTMGQMLGGMSSVEVSQRLALDKIRLKERREAERKAEMKRKRRR